MFAHWDKHQILPRLYDLQPEPGRGRRGCGAHMGPLTFPATGSPVPGSPPEHVTVMCRHLLLNDFFTVSQYVSHWVQPGRGMMRGGSGALIIHGSSSCGRLWQRQCQTQTHPQSSVVWSGPGRSRGGGRAAHLAPGDPGGPSQHASRAEAPAVPGHCGPAQQPGAGAASGQLRAAPPVLPSPGRAAEPPPAIRPLPSPGETLDRSCVGCLCCAVGSISGWHGTRSSVPCALLREWAMLYRQVHLNFGSLCLGQHILWAGWPGGDYWDAGGGGEHECKHRPGVQTACATRLVVKPTGSAAPMPNTARGLCSSLVVFKAHADRAPVRSILCGWTSTAWQRRLPRSRAPWKLAGQLQPTSLGLKPCTP